MDDDSFANRLASALSGIADGLEAGGELVGIVPQKLLSRLDEGVRLRFARAARHLSDEIERGRWDSSLPRCTGDELLLQHALDLAMLNAESEGVDCTDDAAEASEILLMDDDVLLLFGLDAEVVSAPEFAAATSAVNLAVADWWIPFRGPTPGREAP